MSHLPTVAPLVRGQQGPDLPPTLLPNIQFPRGPVAL